MPHIVVVVGTRPEIIKLIPVYRALMEVAGLDVSLLSTGQHREMSRQAFGAFGVTPDVELELMTSGQSLAEFTARALTGLTDCFSRTHPDAVIVQGDTTTTLAASMAACYLQIKVGHIEAGMRTGNLYSPWPEEINRRLTAQLCHWHFVPVQRNLDNLIREGINPARCFICGNTVVDALLWTREQVAQDVTLSSRLKAKLKLSEIFFTNYLSDNRCAPLVLVTGHRRESHGQGILNLCEAISQIVKQHPQVGVLFPVHLNPNVKSVVESCLGSSERIVLTAPLDYREFVWVMDRCHFIISDSGGIQGEALTLQKPLLVTRDTTEYPEGIESGGCQLVGTEVGAIVDAASTLLTDRQQYVLRSSVINPYGDGRSSQKIASIIAQELLPDRLLGN